MRGWSLLERIVRAFFPRIAFHSRSDNFARPAIFVANHENAFGPIATYLYFPVRVHPWVMFELTEKGACAAYLAREFFQRELRLRLPCSRLLARLIEPVCIALFRRIGAVPVYHNSRRIIETVSRSIVLLEEGEHLIVFPEIPEAALNRYINRFNTGFLEIVKSADRDGGSHIPIYPVCIDRRRRLIRVGAPLQFDYSRNFVLEKQRMKREIERAITLMKAKLGGE
ncbi:MAG: 1-acyl-sn-glycerol-3-phosphate acyltransferase [Spirochaetales bacterium]|nr:1-acyl-sn-glycerol-3-phosphate acyltransferase [Spirochaetales bacterium]